jgi:hypothetical protein
VRTTGAVVLCLCLSACGGGKATEQGSAANPIAPSTVFPQAQPTAGALPVNGDYQGRWVGDFQVTACSGGPYVNTTKLCVDQFSVGSVIPMSLQLYQGPDRVSGTVTMTAASAASGMFSNNYMGTIVGVLDGTGGLSVLGTLLGQGSERNGNVFKITIRDWSAAVTGNQLLSTWTMDFRQDLVAGSGTVVATTPGLTRVPNF